MRRHEQPWGRALFMFMSFSGVLMVIMVAVTRLLMIVERLDLVLNVLQ
ncbi:MAG: hypothetical protein LC729_03645 [Acidobacteria bacterium]|nr:hypothetical protein [Acidobacteriota bacterium]